MFQWTENLAMHAGNDFVVHFELAECSVVLCSKKEQQFVEGVDDYFDLVVE